MLSQSVASAIRDAISAGEFQPGQQLSEVKAAERFKCSRNTLREAFTELTSERLVERIPNRGVFIATPDTDYVKALYLSRLALEHAGEMWGDFPAAARLI
ncbi:MAG: GntR family transcriptional regulator, partial [Corynebacterium casei]|nr:GntR family transcriptional regulator [Corynebacterium casei]